MDGFETQYFVEELYGISVKLASLSEGFESKELHEMSARLGSLVAYIDNKPPVGPPLHTEQTENLMETANRAQGAWDSFISKLFYVLSMNGTAYIQKVASDFLSFLDNTLYSAPMNNSLPWGICARNPILPSRLALIMSAERIRHVIQTAEVVSKSAMIQGVSEEYNTFLDKVKFYIQAYEKRIKYE